VKGRKIFGGIVPYDFVVDGKEYPWRAGSNNRTTIEFSNDVTIEGLSLPAGKYGFVILVNKKEWTLIFSNNTSWGAFQYDKKNDVLRVPVKTEKVSHQAWLSYEFVEPKPESIAIKLTWEQTQIKFKVEIDFVGNVIESLSSKEDKNANNYRVLAMAKMIQNPANTDKSLALVERSIDSLDGLEEPYRSGAAFRSNIYKAELLIKKGKLKEGEKLTAETIKSAKGFDIYYYGLSKYMVEGKKEEALKIFAASIKRNPKRWQNHLGFGEYYLKENNQEKATNHFKKAYEFAPDNWKNYARYLYLQNKLILERS